MRWNLRNKNEKFFSIFCPLRDSMKITDKKISSDFFLSDKILKVRKGQSYELDH